MHAQRLEKIMPPSLTLRLLLWLLSLLLFKSILFFGQNIFIHKLIYYYLMCFRLLILFIRNDWLYGFPIEYTNIGLLLNSLPFGFMSISHTLPSFRSLSHSSHVQFWCVFSRKWPALVVLWKTVTNQTNQIHLSIIICWDDDATVTTNIRLARENSIVHRATRPQNQQ